MTDKRFIHEDGSELTKYEKALVGIVKAYEKGIETDDYDLYNRLINRQVTKARAAWEIEDDATDVRLFGIDGC